MKQGVKRLTILAVVIVTLVFQGCSRFKKEIPESESTITTVTQVPEVKAPEESKKKRLKDEAQKVGALQNIYFDFDRYNLKLEAMRTLGKAADWLSKNPTVRIRIEGNCDERGTNEYNLALGERRAGSAKKYFVTLGISPGRISTISYGEERPADPGHNEEAWAINRRDEFKVLE